MKERLVWNRKAAEAGQTISEWIRKVCNREAGVEEEETEEDMERQVFSGSRVGVAVWREGDMAEVEWDDSQREAMAKGYCEHGERWEECEVWGCEHYEVASARGVHPEKRVYDWKPCTHGNKPDLCWDEKCVKKARGIA